MTHNKYVISTLVTVTKICHHILTVAGSGLPFSGQGVIIIPLLQFKNNYYVFMSFRQRLNPILDSLP